MIFIHFIMRCLVLTFSYTTISICIEIQHSALILKDDLFANTPTLPTTIGFWRAKGCLSAQKTAHSNEADIKLDIKYVISYLEFRIFKYITFIFHCFISIPWLPLIVPHLECSTSWMMDLCLLCHLHVFVILNVNKRSIKHPFRMSCQKVYLLIISGYQYCDNLHGYKICLSYM